MKLNKTMQDAVDFANWCDNNGVEFYNAAELIQSTRRYFKLAERECNGEDVKKKLSLAADWVEKFARKCGFSMVRYDGLWPTFCKKNPAGDWYDVYLPGIATR